MRAGSLCHDVLLCGLSLRLTLFLKSLANLLRESCWRKVQGPRPQSLDSPFTEDGTGRSTYVLLLVVTTA